MGSLVSGRARTIASALCLVMLTGALPLARAEAAAAGDDRAQALYDEAKALVIAGRWSEACPKLEESVRLASKMNTVYRLAECYEHVNKNASAWRKYVQAAAAASEAGESGKAKAARDRADKLRPMLSTVVIDATAAADAEIWIDGARVEANDLAAPIPLDPGEHAIEARASSRKTYRTTVTFGDGAGTKTVIVPALEGEEPASRVGPTTPPLLLQGDDPSRHSYVMRTLGIVLVGASVVAVGIGGYVALDARSKYHDVDARCAQGCDYLGASATSEARRQGDIATVVIGAGLALGVAGAVLWLTAPSSSESSSRSASLGLSIGAGTASLHGSF